jgi:hypothetical protein
MAEANFFVQKPFTTGKQKTVSQKYLKYNSQNLTSLFFRQAPYVYDYLFLNNFKSRIRTSLKTKVRSRNSVLYFLTNI